jgi:hypothetical protein
MPRAQNTTNPGSRSIAAKRNASTVGRLKRKAERGETTGNERAVVRIGTMNTKLLTGQEDLSAWSDEELQRGQRKDRNGRWQGRKPRVVPKAVHDELVKRTLSKAQDLFRDNLVTAVEVLTDIVTDDSVEPKDKLRAIAMITDRVMGKAPERVELSGDTPWMVALTGAIVSVKNVQDAEPEEEDDLDGEV